MGRVHGKISLITGGGSGIGRASAITLAREGSSVVITDLNKDTAQETADLINESGGKSRWMQQDTTDEKQWLEVIESLRKNEGGLHILLNNAGVSNGGGHI